jgi:hypothetical protein
MARGAGASARRPGKYEKIPEIAGTVSGVLKVAVAFYIIIF